MLSHLRLVMRIVIAASIALGLTFVFTRGNFREPPENKTELKMVDNSVAEMDQRLQSTAAATLGQQEGAIVILDPQTGRLRAVGNPGLAFQQAFTPGSTIKPFTALTALRSNVIQTDTRMRCRHKYKRTDLVDTCSHPADPGPLSPAEAVAYSCNYYFAKVGERIAEQDFATTVSQFGFGQLTGINDEKESAGNLARGRWQPESAVGEGAFLQVTPIQMATAYAAIFNGGRLFKPTLAPAAGFTEQLQAQLQIENDTRSILLEGMRGAVTFGTAAKAELDDLPIYVIGKTGTATPLQGFRSQGWFVGLAFTPDAQTGPTNAQLVVVVYLRKAHGSDAAEVARAIFAEFAGVRREESESTQIAVHQVRENVTRRVPLEDYLLQVVASEAGIEDEPEALKALAVATRTYALKNTGRHKAEGYDLCSTTHCQRFANLETRPALAHAVSETAGLVLRDDRNRIADAYFSASCGGMTANVKTLWGAEAPPYLRGVRDNYCNSGSHYRWTDVISVAKLATALRSDSRTDVGQTIRQLSVAKYDSGGRAEKMTISGDRSRTISGWEFKLIVGRALGWNVLKSSRFSVSRSGSQFVFRGGGFGHGLGLCQEGSHAMAQRGHSFQQILAHYFPGTTLSNYRNDVASVRSSHFRLVHPRTVATRDAQHMLDVLEKNRSELINRVSTAGLEVRFPDLEVILNDTTGDFTGRTGMPPWAAAATRNNKIELQPLKLLKQRRILETTLRHELVHVLVDALGQRQTPRWFTEGMALYLAGEGRLFERPQETLSSASVEQALASAKSAGEMKSAYAGAYHLVKELIRREGERKVWKRLADRSYSVKVTTVSTLIA